mgnify:FL=1
MNDPMEHTKKYPVLAQLSTQALEDLLRQDVTPSADSNDSAERILAIMEVIHAREAQQPSPIDADTAWETFLARNTVGKPTPAPDHTPTLSRKNAVPL